VALLIAIEGIDGSGKGTQAQILTDRLKENGFSSELVSFPQYDQTLFGSAIGDFLNGKFGSLNEVNPFLASLLYAGDRFESKPMLMELLKKNDVVVLDRYVSSNIAHQGSKFSGDQQAELIEKIRKIEFEINGLPRTDLTILLDITSSLSQILIARKQKRTYTDSKADLQEADSEYLASVREVYKTLADQSEDWTVVPVGLEGKEVSEPRTIDDISEEIWKTVIKKIQAA
jgi:dTMP kinase